MPLRSCRTPRRRQVGLWSGHTHAICGAVAYNESITRLSSTSYCVHESNFPDLISESLGGRRLFVGTLPFAPSRERGEIPLPEHAFLCKWAVANRPSACLPLILAYYVCHWPSGGGAHLNGVYRHEIWIYRDVNLVQNVGGRPVQGVWGTDFPVGSRGEAPVGGLGDEVPQKLKQFWISICIILT